MFSKHWMQFVLNLFAEGDNITDVALASVTAL